MFENAVNEVKTYVFQLSQLGELVKALIDFKKLKITQIMEYAEKEEPEMHKQLQNLISAFHTLSGMNRFQKPFWDEQQYNSIHKLVMGSANYFQHRFGINLSEFSQNPTQFGNMSSKIVPLINLVRNRLMIEDGPKQQKKAKDGEKQQKNKKGEKDRQKRTMPKEGANGAKDNGANGILGNWPNAADEKRRRRRNKRGLLGLPFLVLVLLYILIMLILGIMKVTKKIVTFVNDHRNSSNVTRHDESSAAMLSSSEAPHSSAAASSSTEKNISKEKNIQIKLFQKLSNRLAISKGQCAICLGDLADLEANTTVKQLPSCNHEFHNVCMELWLLTKGNCPICRAEIFVIKNGKVKLNFTTKYGTFGNA
ncbi:hypothetical protein niasHT_015256 [Heterodera trifolii]|uniref:RING-type domain-containing protein n=1 Tax=Heterodera trifolii TaxID=157864 RepID=A0ABD2L2K0_9BILA